MAAHHFLRGAVVVDPATAWYAVGLVRGVGTDDAALLLATDLEGTVHRLLVEEQLPDLLFHTVSFQCVSSLLGQIQVFHAPVRHKLRFAPKVRPAKVAGTRLTGKRRPRPLEPVTGDV